MVERGGDVVEGDGGRRWWWWGWLWWKKVVVMKCCGDKNVLMVVEVRVSYGGRSNEK